MMTLSIRRTLIIVACVLAPRSQAQESQPQAAAAVPIEAAASEEELDLTDLSLAELLDIEVTVASRTPQRASDAAAAVYVITGDEIRRAGHSSIPEALRMVPGLYVSQFQAGGWDVTSRGFGNGLSQISFVYQNQLLVMIDGVVVYSPLYAGVGWALQDIDVNEIERIEIIRGPGGMLWGANAVHGVLNVITKHSESTQGTRLHTRVSRDELRLNARYGGTFGETGTYRVWSSRGRFEALHDDTVDVDKGWSLASAGGRFDWQTEEGKQAMVRGRLYDGRFAVPNFGFPPPAYFGDEAWGGSLTWQLTDPEEGSSWKASYIKDRQSLDLWVDFDLDIFNLDFQDQWHRSESSTLTWGLGYEFVNSRLNPAETSGYLQFDPATIDQHNARAFVVDSTRFHDGEMELIVGLQAVRTKFEDLELQPSLRFGWDQSPTTKLWAAISRAVRTPTIEEASLTVFGTPRPSPLESETLLAYELGWRETLSETFAVDVSAYYNDYKSLETLYFDEDTFETFYDNEGRGSAVGAEVAVDAIVRPGWKLRGSYSYIHGSHRHSDDTPLDTDAYHPTHIASLRSYFDLSEDLELDAGVYGVDGFGPDFEVAEYVRADLRLGWRPSDDLLVSFGVQGLNDSRRSEYLSQEVRRQWFLEVAWTR